MFIARAALLVLLALAACGKDGDDSQSGTSTTVDPTTTTPLTTGTTGTPTSGTTIDTSNTDGASTMTAPETTTEGTTESSTTGDLTTPSSTSTETTDPGTTSGTSTTGEPVAFDLFRKSSAAGPCPPNADCDGFVELLASGTLRVEKFGDVGNKVTEVDIAADDFTAAVAVFTDPALIAILDGPDPACDPPTDIFESMLLQIDGADHDTATTLCDQPPIVAARAKANELEDKYVP